MERRQKSSLEGKHEDLADSFTLGNDCTLCSNSTYTTIMGNSNTSIRFHMTTWKHCERMVAKLLGGERTGCNGESRRDVEHDRWSIEVKHRKTLPKWLHSAMKQAEIEAEHRVPIVVLHEKNLTYEDSYVIMRLNNFTKETNNDRQTLP